MKSDIVDGDSGRLTKLLGAAALAVVAIASLRSNRRVVGALAGVGAIGLGLASSRQNAPVVIETVKSRVRGSKTSEAGSLSCAACHEPIVVGQVRQPNAENRPVHAECL